MGYRTGRVTVLGAVLMTGAVAANADADAAARWRRAMADSAASMGVALPEPAAVAVPVSVVEISTPPASGDPRTDTEYEYPDITKELESYTRFKRVAVGKKKYKVVPLKKTGVLPGDRLNRGTITDIVLHSSLGQAPNPTVLAQRDAATASGVKRFDSCQSSVNFLNQRASAAHFIVCRDGRVKQMAEIKDFANHVKDPDFNDKSIGIETDTGFADMKHPFYPAGGNYAGDWDPDTRWRQSASLAKLIRMLSKLTEGRIALTEDHIKTHEDVDVPYCNRVGCDAHRDPGPYFKTEAVKTFGDPATPTTPWKNLMRLVQDTTAPKTTFVSQNGQPDQVKVWDDTGLVQVTIWKLLVPRTSIDPTKPLDPKNPVVRKAAEWLPDADRIPDAEKTMVVPSEPGEYQIESRDLVGNRSYRDFDVAAPAPPAVVGTFGPQPGPASRVVAFEPRTGADDGGSFDGAAN